MKDRKLKINSDFVAGYKKDDVVTIHVDANNVPTNPFWRKALKDAQMDGCCELVKVKAAKKPKREGGKK